MEQHISSMDNKKVKDTKMGAIWAFFFCKCFTLNHVGEVVCGASLLSVTIMVRILSEKSNPSMIRSMVFVLSFIC